ncbi:MAG: serine/threonine protein kinase [Deltaproteobacteria bacterium]|nr:serine/threonine protein kinase [Deltaproteobacteria bacterium]
MTAGLVGTRLGRYEILQELGQGGMSVVYKATDTELRRPVAIKVMHAFLAEQAEARERFHREAVAVARLRHPHIIEIFDFSGENAKESYIVTELVEGETLAALLQRVPLTPPEAALLLSRSIAAALAHAHAQGIIHRDLKPENILVGNNGTLKLTDFGISRMLDSNTLTVTGTLLGSPAYMAPEYIDGYATDARADIFSFGTMLYQFATGKLPFEGATPHALLKRIATCEFAPPELVNPEVHAAISRIIKRCLTRLPEDRYPTVDALLVDLDSSLNRVGLHYERDLQALLAGPQAFGDKLKASLAPVYLDLGKKALAAGATGPAIEDFDRVLGLDPKNTEVRGILDRLAWRAQLRRFSRLGGLAAVGALLVSVGGAYLIDAVAAWRSEQERELRPPPVTSPPSTGDAVAPAAPPLRNTLFLLKGSGDLFLDDVKRRARASGAVPIELAPGKHKVKLVGAKRTMVREITIPQTGPVSAVELDVSVTEVTAAPPPKTKAVEFKPAGMWVTAFVDDTPEAAVKNAMKNFTLTLAYGKHRLRFVNDRAQLNEMELAVSDSEPPGVVVVRMVPRPAKLKVVGAPDGAVVEVAGKRTLVDQWTRDEPINVPLDVSPTQFDVLVKVAGKADLHSLITFTAGESHTLEVPETP